MAQNPERKRPQALQSVISQTSLRTYYDFTERFTQWQQLLAECLTETQRDHCILLNLRDQQLLVAVPSGAWLTQLKAQESRIITHFQANATSKPNRLIIQVLPKLFSAKEVTESSPKKAEASPQPKAEELSQADVLRKQAERCEEPLRSQLLALAARYDHS